MSLDTFITLRKRFHTFSYDSFQIERTDEGLNLHFEYQLISDEEVIPFHHKVVYVNQFGWDDEMINTPLFEHIVTEIGIAEGINYYKLACSPVYKINVINLVDQQKQFWNKLIYLGLGEFLYLNDIYGHVTKESLVTIESEGIHYPLLSMETKGALIPVGGGKDSCVTLELLKDSKAENAVYFMNPLQSAMDCATVAGYSQQQHRIAKRIFDQRMIQMNNEGFLNGHVPYSAILAFIASGIACLDHKQYIVLSNEDSSNETTVIGTEVNHQYSKSIEFENDFRHYFNTYISKDIEYFSLLRPWSEMKIAREFAKYTHYHSQFRSCNKGSKQNIWCGQCPKCLFVASILSVFLDKQALNNIFGKDMLEDITLDPIMLELIGQSETKPFECVGTIEEVQYALTKTSHSYESVPKLLQGKTFTLNMSQTEKHLFSNNSSHNVPDVFKPFVLIP